MVNSLIDLRKSCSILIFISFYCVIWINAISDKGLRQERSLRPLSKYILHHEPLSYNSKIVYDRAKRSINAYEDNKYLKDNLSNTTQNYNFINKKPTTVNIDFFAHNRHFNLRLYPDLKSVFSDKLAIVDSDGKELNINLDHIYSGYLEDDEHFSKVYGHVVNGVFEGKIHSKNGTFYIERANRYLASKKKNVHSVIYDSKDVVHPHSDHFEGGCMDQKTKEWMEMISRSAVEEEKEDYDLKSLDKNQLSSKEMNKLKYETTNEQLCDHPNTRAKRQSDFFSSGIVNNYHPFFSNGYLDKGGRIRNPQHRISLNPRDRGPYSSKPFLLYYPTSSVDNLKRRACSLYIQTDTFLWNHIRKDVDSDSKAREEISSLVAQHIKAVNHIYENTDFGGYRGLKFIVQRLKINDSSACDSSNKRKTNPFCSPNIDVSNFLNLNSQFNHDDFCLAYIFTYRDFSGGTLGLAWVASTSGASGGICEKYKSYTENVHGTQVQTKRSLNTGIITFVNYNSRVPPKVSELTLAHEIGHNFGSPHDYPTECRPGGVTGNYIMYSSATSGERLNNNKFSICSLRNISTVLNSVFKEEGKINCFQEDEGPFCGNKIVEENEECDCGYDAKECSETCCYPKDNPEDPVAKSCTRPKGILCSPSEGPCCNEQCKFEKNSKQCRAENECTYESVCSGIGAQCPLPRPKSNNTECNSGTQVCINGQCIGSICLKYNLEECFLTSKNGARPEEMCEVACQRGNDASTCKRTSEIESMKKISGLKLRPGSPCNDFQGYCDIFQKCRAVDAEGPLAQLKNLLLNQKTLLSIKQWVTKNWWACIVIGLSVVMFMAAFIKCCAVHTPSSNPKKRPAVRISDTLRHPADTLRRKRHRSNQSRQNNNHRSNGNSSSTNNPSNNVASNIPLQPTAPPLPTQYPSQAYQQTQLTVALPPESTITFTSTSNRAMNEPPPPYPGYGPNLNSYKTSIINNQQPPPLPPPRPNSIANQNLTNINSSGAGSINSASSSTNSSNNLLPSRGYGEGRGHYNRKGQSNVPTKVKQTQPVSSTSSNKQSAKTNNSNKKNSKK